MHVVALFTLSTFADKKIFSTSDSDVDEQFPSPLPSPLSLCKLSGEMTDIELESALLSQQKCFQRHKNNFDSFYVLLSLSRGLAKFQTGKIRNFYQVEFFDNEEKAFLILKKVEIFCA